MKSRTKHNVYSLFEEWVKDNNSQLNVPLIRAPYKKGKLYYFKGIPDTLLSLQVDDGGIVVHVWYDDQPVEMLLDLDAVLGYNRGNGYYCKLCTEPQYYKSIKEFYTQHCYERLRIWINTKLALSQFIDIYFFGGRDGSSCAQLSIDIKSKKQFLREMKSLFKKTVVEKIRVDLWNQTGK